MDRQPVAQGFELKTSCGGTKEMDGILKIRGGLSPALILVLLCPQGCTPDDHFRSRPSLSSQVQFSGLRWLKENIDQHPCGPIETVCIEFSMGEEFHGLGVEVSGHLDERQLERFITDSLGFHVKPVPACELRSFTGELLDTESGVPAAFFHISLPDFNSPESAQIEIGFHIGGHWGKGWDCSAELQSGKWEVGACEESWQS